MLMCKIESIEVVSRSKREIDLKVTNKKGDIDLISLDHISNMSCLIGLRIYNAKSKSFRLFGDELTNKVQKVDGALAGLVFNIYEDSVEVDLEGRVERSIDNVNGETVQVTIINIGNAKIKIKSTVDTEPEIEFEIN